MRTIRASLKGKNPTFDKSAGDASRTFSFLQRALFRWALFHLPREALLCSIESNVGRVGCVCDALATSERCDSVIHIGGVPVCRILGSGRLFGFFIVFHSRLCTWYCTDSIFRADMFNAILELGFKGGCISIGIFVANRFFGDRCDTWRGRRDCDEAFTNTF